MTDAGEKEFPHIAQVTCILREVPTLTGKKLSRDIAIQVVSRPRMK